MPRKLPGVDPSGTLRRKAVAGRRVGVGTRCPCGESRPEALIADGNPLTCAACQRTAKGLKTSDEHHFAGKANNPATISIPVNDHRAILSVRQAEWPKSTLRNVEESPLLAGAACLRGCIDSIAYLTEKGLFWLADMLEKLDQVLAKQLGPKWWVNTEIEQFAPRKKPNAKP